MPEYRILAHPGLSPVFFDASEALTLSELSLCLRRLPGCDNARILEDCGLRWAAFDAEHSLSNESLAKLGHLSCAYALFVKESGLLRPLPLVRDTRIPESLSAIPKYTGKTNPLFTRLMLHLAELSLSEVPARPLSLLDPVAGKGTTLFEGAMRGWNVSGIEIVQSAAHDAAVYFRKYLETEHWKHLLHEEKNHGAFSWQFTYAPDKDALKTDPRSLSLIAGDSSNAVRFYGKSAFDLIVGDLPYGVQHGNIAGGERARSPKALLEHCLPFWREVLRTGGIIALSWNLHVLPVQDMRSLLEHAGLVPLTGSPYDTLAHRVDASILRDIVLAIKP